MELKSKKRSLISIFIFCVFIGCINLETNDFFLGQGIIVGEVTDKTAIIQTRLTVADTLIEGYLPGQEGYVQFLYKLKNQNTNNWIKTNWLYATAKNDFIVKAKLQDLVAGQEYTYRAKFGIDTLDTMESPLGSFITNPGKFSENPVSLAIGACMNYYHFHFGKYEAGKEYSGADKDLGYPALQAIKDLNVDYFIGAGDNVYFDHPNERAFQKAQENGSNPNPGWFDGEEVKDEKGMRRKYHHQFVQPRFKDLFATVGTYWLKDDHDYINNDSDPFTDFPITHALGVKNFREQLPVVDPDDKDAKTYRTIRITQDLQIWLLEGRDFRSANKDDDSPSKSIWGATQKSWLQNTLLESDASFKLIISPTPMVGPDDAYKSDNHVNQLGFHIEGEAFFDWLMEEGFLLKNLYFICGDRHWQYHARHPKGFEEFSVGALVDNNSRIGRVAGDPKSTDPHGLIEQYYVHGTKEDQTGGFLHVETSNKNDRAIATFSLYDENGKLNYRTIKQAEKL